MADNLKGSIHFPADETVFAVDQQGNTRIPIDGAVNVITKPLRNHGLSSWRFVTTGAAVDLVINCEFADCPDDINRIEDQNFLIDSRLTITGGNITGGSVSINSATTTRVNLIEAATLPEPYVRFNITGQSGNGADTVLQIRQSAQAYLK